MIWFLTFVFCIIVFAYIAAPLYFKNLPNEESTLARKNVTNAYREELKDIEKDINADNENNEAIIAQKSALEKRLIESATQTLNISSKPKPISAAAIFMLLCAGTAGTYFLIGSPHLVSNEALQPVVVTAPPPRGPSRDDIAAAAQMNPDERAAMIQGMVDGLSEKLTENPDDPEGWVTLLRARKVLNQTLEAEAELKAMKTHFNDKPDLITQILAKSGWDN